MNDLMRLIMSRRSTREYLDKPVDRQLIEQILDAGRSAPSSLNTQPWRFAVITDKRLINDIASRIKDVLTSVYRFLPILRILLKELRDEKLAGAIKKTAMGDDDTVFYGAPLVILILSSKKGRWVRTDCALAAQNMMLSAHSFGLGSCFIGRGDIINKKAKILRDLGIEKKYRIQATLVFGYPAQNQTHVPERDKKNVLIWR